MTSLERYADVLEKLPPDAREAVERKLAQGWDIWMVKVGETIELARGAASFPNWGRSEDFWVVAGSPTVEFRVAIEGIALMGGGCFKCYSITFNNVGDAVAYEEKTSVNSEFRRTRRLYVCVRK